MLSNLWFYEVFAMRLESTQSADLVSLHQAGITNHIGGQDRGEATLHPCSPFRDSLAKHRGKIYLAEAGSNVGCWHKADLRRARLVGLPTGALPTFEA